MIPLDHVYALLRTSMALINPSRFEGWSTTVEEAKSFGVPMILSDIDVHREQTGGTARYFGVDDPGRWLITFQMLFKPPPNRLFPAIYYLISTSASERLRQDLRKPQRARCPSLAQLASCWTAIV